MSVKDSSKSHHHLNANDLMNQPKDDHLNYLVPEVDEINQRSRSENDCF